MAADGSKKAIAAAFIANLGIAIAKFVGFAITASASMLAEGIHSVADTTNQGLLFLGGAQARREATPEHPFGYGRARYFWAFVVALILFSLGGMFAIYEGVEKLRHPHEVESLGVAAGILIFGLLLEGWSFRTAVRESNPLRGRKSWWRFIRESKTPELPVVLLEDLGALIGLSVALAGVVLSATTDNPRWDAAGSLTIGLLLVAIAILLAVEMRSLLLGEAASPENLVALREAIEAGDDVVRLIHMRTEHLAPDHLLVGAKVEFDRALSVSELADAIDGTEARARAAVPIAKTIYLEPDLFDADQESEQSEATRRHPSS